VDHLGPRARLAYAALSRRLRDGELAPGSRLPNQRQLAAELGVAPMTLREVLDALEGEGLISSEHGRGTFVRAAAVPAVLILDDEPSVRSLLAHQVTAAGCRPIPAAEPAEALAILEREPSVALVLADVRVPTAAAGTAFIRAVRRGWPHLALAAVTAFPDDLAELHGTPECPILILTKPFREGLVEEALALVLDRHPQRRAPG
jgi:DNA-binding transcriptional regulator YhcF (GntR family)